MKINIYYLIFLTSILVLQKSYSQVDVVYTNLVWSDEFDTNGPVNSSKWHHQTQLPAGGSWFNGEVQNYTNLLSNSFVNNSLKLLFIKKLLSSKLLPFSLISGIMIEPVLAFHPVKHFPEGFRKFIQMSVHDFISLIHKTFQWCF